PLVSQRLRRREDDARPASGLSQIHVNFLPRRVPLCPRQVRFHLRLAEEFGAELVRKGAVKRRARSVVAKAAAPMMTTGPKLTATAIAPPNVLTVECPCCGVRSEVEAPFPDVSARLVAIELLLREALGRLQQLDEPCLLRRP